MKKYYIYAITLLVGFACSVVLASEESEPSAKEMYFNAQVRAAASWVAKVKKVDPNSAMALNAARGMVSCNMDGMSKYTEYYQNLAYDVFIKGGTLKEAENTLNMAIDKAIEAGGKDGKKAKKMRSMAEKAETKCLKKMGISRS